MELIFDSERSGDELISLLLENLGRSLAVVKQFANFIDFVEGYFQFAEGLGEDISWLDKLHSETERRLCADSR